MIVHTDLATILGLINALSTPMRSLNAKSVVRYPDSGHVSPLSVGGCCASFFSSKSIGFVLRYSNAATLDRGDTPATTL
jgi:hypothetical protein